MSLVNILRRSLVTTAAVTGSVFMIFSAGSVFAASLNSSKANSATLTQAQQSDLSNLKTKGGEEISRRLTSLKNALGAITATTKLSANDKTYLENEINNELDGLTSLQSTLSSETTLAGARAEVQSIFTDYRVYALVLAKARLITAADAELNTDADLTTLQTNIQSQLTADQTAGKNITTLQADLTTMEGKTSAAQSIASNEETTLLPLQPSDYDADHSILNGDLAQIKTAHSDNVAAYAEAQTIVSGLNSL